jgi:sedoheptulose-bisphosphatase
LGPDAYQIFMKGHGIFSTVGSKTNPVKLRTLYETVPIALLIEAAGGLSSDGHCSLLDSKITDFEQRSQIIVGSKNDVAYMEEIIKKCEDSQ